MSIIRFLRTLSLYSLIGASLFLFVISYLNPKLSNTLRGVISDITAPIIIVFDNVVYGIESVVDTVQDVYYVYTQNQELQAQMADYNEKSVALSTLEQDYTHLKETVKYTQRFAIPKGILAKAISKLGGVYDPIFILDKGTLDGVRVGQVIIFDGNLAGYITDVSKYTSRAIYITSVNASVPVIAKSHKHRGIIKGDGVRKPLFIYADSAVHFSVGDVLLTSGDGDVFPAGLPVGKIQAIYNQNNIRIETFVNKNDVNFVYILHHTPKIILRGE